MPLRPYDQAAMKGLLVVGVVFAVGLAGYSATLVLGASTAYEQSSCSPTVPKGCTGYTPSSYNGGPAASAQGDPFWTGVFASIAAILGGLAGKTWFDRHSGRKNLRSISFGLLAGVGFALVLTAIAANTVSYPASEYQPSKCTPTVPGGCAGYTPSTYSVGPTQGNWPGALFFAILALAGAIYLGRTQAHSEPYFKTV